MAGCGETCSWCDTLYSKVRSASCAITLEAGGEVREIPNPITVKTAIRALRDVSQANPETSVVSITGGEPLEQVEFVRALAAQIKQCGKTVYLETNGVHDSALAEVLPFTDVIAMDIKLPSATRKPLWDAHMAFLSRLENTAFDPACDPDQKEKKSVFVKIVIDDKSSPEEVELAVRLVASVGRSIPLVLQPESGILLAGAEDGDRRKKMDAALDAYYKVASAKLDNVRVIPQVHRLLNIR